MFYLSGVFLLLCIAGFVLYRWKRKIFDMNWLLWLFVLMVFFTIAAIIGGWWTAEIGRQPWIVYNVLTTADGVSPVLTGGQVLFSLIMFVVLYTILFILFIFLLNEKIQAGPEPLEEVETVPVGSLPDTFRQIFRRPGGGPRASDIVGVERSEP